MPRFIIKLDDKYLEWSTIVDAPVTRGMTREEFKDYYMEEYRLRSDSFDERMKRVDQKGVSAHNYDSAEELIEFNRAGPNEECLTKEELIKLISEGE